MFQVYNTGFFEDHKGPFLKLRVGILQALAILLRIKFKIEGFPYGADIRDKKSECPIGFTRCCIAGSIPKDG